MPALPSGPRHLLVSRRPRFVRDRPPRPSSDRSPTQRLCRRAPDLARPSSSCRGGVGMLSLAALLSSPRRRDFSRRRLVPHRRRLRVRPRASSSRARAPRRPRLASVSVRARALESEVAASGCWQPMLLGSIFFIKNINIFLMRNL